jgi:hypothetical protein
MGLSGNKLPMPYITDPSQLSCVVSQIPGSANFADHCEMIPQGQSRDLCEIRRQPPQIPYYIRIVAEPGPLLISSFESFINAVQAPGRKTDFLIIGPDPCHPEANTAFVLVVELRESLRTFGQCQDKIAQCRDSLDKVCADGINWGNFHHTQTGPIRYPKFNFMQNHRVSGLIVPVIASVPRVFTNVSFQFGRKAGRIVALPDSVFKSPVSWKDLLIKMGLITC